jgi:uncharacterized phiE125 gp8 family phage protein
MDTIIFGTPHPPNSTLTPYRSLVRVTNPAVEPVSLAMAKSQCRIDTDAENEYIQNLIAVARQYVEDVLDITLCTTVWEARYDLFPVWAIVLPRAPMASANVTVTYRNGDGTTASITSDAGNFQVDSRGIPGRIFPKWAEAWPPTRGDENSVIVRYTAGYGADGTSVPPVAKHLILMLVAHLFESRQPAVVGGVASVPYTFDTLLAASGLGVNYR